MILLRLRILILINNLTTKLYLPIIMHNYNLVLELNSSLCNDGFIFFLRVSSENQIKIIQLFYDDDSNDIYLSDDYRSIGQYTFNIRLADYNMTSYEAIGRLVRKDFHPISLEERDEIIAMM